jgi:uncharacterized membrane protein
MPVKVLRTDARTDVVIVLLAGVVIDGLVMIGVDMLTEVGIVVVVRAVIAFESFVTASCMVDVRAMPISLERSLRFCC